MPRTPKKKQPTDVPDAVLDYFAGPARVITSTAVDLAVPRDRAGTFAPVLIPKHERRFNKTVRRGRGESLCDACRLVAYRRTVAAWKCMSRRRRLRN
jgi:hypothetical protein